MATNDIYEVVHKGSVQGQEVLNIYHYRELAAGTNAEDLANAFWVQMHLSIIDILSQQWDGVTITATNISGADDQYIRSIANDSGGQLGEMLPVWNTASFELVTPSTLMRNGRKAYGPLAEAQSLGGVPSSSAVTAFNTLAQTLSTPIQLSSTDAWQLVLYREGAFGNVIADVSNVVFKRLSTQNSRKPF